jgi:hypothetical protein
MWSRHLAFAVDILACYSYFLLNILYANTKIATFPGLFKTINYGTL